MPPTFWEKKSFLSFIIFKLSWIKKSLVQNILKLYSNLFVMLIFSGLVDGWMQNPVYSTTEKTFEYLTFIVSVSFCFLSFPFFFSFFFAFFSFFNLSASFFCCRLVFCQKNFFRHTCLICTWYSLPHQTIKMLVFSSSDISTLFELNNTFKCFLQKIDFNIWQDSSDGRAGA